MPLVYQELLNANPPFPIYKDRKDYKERTGQEAPPYSPDRPLKFWADVNAGADGAPEVVYLNNIMLKSDGYWFLRNGAPTTKPLVLTAEEAQTVNLPPEDPSGNTVVPANTKVLACPFRDLGSDEVLAIAGPEMGMLSGTQIVIRNTKLYAAELAKEADDSGKFTPTDRALLKAIASRLGVQYAFN